jgi:predicted transposase YdaD
MGSSDHELYQLFKAEPRFLGVFVEMKPNETYTFESVTFKSFQRQCDGILKSDNPDEATVIFEFQMQKKANIYARIISEMVMYHSEHITQKVRGVIVFKDRKTDPGDQNWKPVAETCPGLLKVLYLDEVYQDLKASQPESPLQAVFAPFVENDPNLIRRNARKWSQQLNQLPYTPEQRETFLKIFLSWLANSLPNLSEKELTKMTSLAHDISHTRFYKDVLQKGKAEGKAEGREEGLLKGKIVQLQELLDEGAITQEFFDLKVRKLKEQEPS